MKLETKKKREIGREVGRKEGVEEGIQGDKNGVREGMRKVWCYDSRLRNERRKGWRVVLTCGMRYAVTGGGEKEDQDCEKEQFE